MLVSYVVRPGDADRAEGLLRTLSGCGDLTLQVQIFTVIYSPLARLRADVLYSCKNVYYVIGAIYSVNTPFEPSTTCDAGFSDDCIAAPSPC